MTTYCVGYSEALENEEINSKPSAGNIEQEDHHTQDKSSVDDSDCIGYSKDQDTGNEEPDSKTSAGNNSVNHPSSVLENENYTEGKTSQMDLPNLLSQNETESTLIFDHTHSDSDSVELRTLTSTSSHESSEFVDITDSTAQLSIDHKVTSGQVDSFHSSNTLVWTTPSGINTHGTFPNQTPATHRHSVLLTPYIDSMVQAVPGKKDSDSSQVFQVQMGTVEGVVPGTEFSAYAPNNTFLCTFIAQSVRIAQTILVRKAIEDVIIPIPLGACAEVSEWRNEPMILHVYTPVDFQYTANLFPPTRSRSTHKFVQALSIEKAHIVVQNDEDGIIIQPQTSTMCKGQHEIHVALNSNPAHLADGKDGVAHFNYFLNHSNELEANTLKGLFAFEMHHLQGDYPHRKPGKNMVKDGEVQFASDAHAKYGFTIRNKSPVNLFPYLFYFDPDKFTIHVSSLRL
jgi:hypothetical protein